MLIQLREERGGDHGPSMGALKFEGADIGSIDLDDLRFLLRTKGLRLTTRSAIKAELLRRRAHVPNRRNRTL